MNKRPRPSDFSKMLDLSTAHISVSVRDFLQENEGDPELGIVHEDLLPIRWVNHKYGWVMWLTEPEKGQDWSNAPELEAINRFAYENGCILVNFDADAEENDRFLTFK